MQTYRLPPIRRVLTSFINGSFLPEPTSTAGLPPNVFAATAEPLGHYCHASALEVENALKGASDSHEAWSRRTPAERGRVLMDTARLIHERSRLFAELETVDTSRPIAETSVVDVKSATDALEYFGGSAPAQHVGETHRCGPGPQSFTYTMRESLGVTVGIGAFNYPLQSAVWKMAPALVYGNTMVFKPSEHTPMTALELAKCLKEAGLPDGVFSVVLGRGADVGEQLCKAPVVKKISFTGSVTTGKHIARVAASKLAKVSLELGGKSPLIIFPDADLNKALAGTMIANFYSNGEVCSNGTRVFVHESIYDSFISKLVSRVQRMRLGHPLDPKTDMSALINPDHLAKVLDYIDVGRTDGAVLACGGTRVLAEDFEHWGVSRGDAERLALGAFMTPAVFKDCHDDHRIVKEEIFGPVACILKFKTEEEVIQRAQDTQFGLAGGVFTNDLTRAHRVAHALSVGQFYINNYNLAPVEVPWGGMKNSGVGRENGRAALHEWTSVKTVHVELDGVVEPYPHTVGKVVE